MDIKSRKLDGKRIALCVTGSIAAIESPKIARELCRHGAEVTAYMSKDARKIIHPYTMEFATGKPAITELTGKVEHLYEFELILIAPATAATIGKLAHGIADTPITALALTAKANAKILLAPAMDLKMYKNEVFESNLRILKNAGFEIIEPNFEEEKAKLADMEIIVDAAIAALHKKDLSGLKVLVSAGPTLEYIDAIRIITNKSSGKTGIAIAKEAYFRGADVKLIYGHGSVAAPKYLNAVKVETSQEMLAAVEREIPECDVFVSSAAVSDFGVEKAAKKIETSQLQLKLKPVPKILGKVKNTGAFKVGFKALHDVSTRELINAAKKILREYNLDLVVANDVAAGIFGSDTSEVYIVDKKKVVHIPTATKVEIAEQLWDIIIRKMKLKGIK